MKSRHTFILISLLVIADLLVINGAYAFFHFGGYISFSGDDNRYDELLPSALNVAYLIAIFLTGIYRLKRLQRVDKMFESGIYTFLMQCAIVFVFGMLLPGSLLDSNILYVLMVELTGLIAVRIFVHLLNNYYPNLSDYKQHIAIIGNSNTVKSLNDYFLQNSLTYKVSGVYTGIEREAQLQVYNQLEESITGKEVDEIYVEGDAGHDAEMSALLEMAEQHCVRVKYVKAGAVESDTMQDFEDKSFLLNSTYNGLSVYVKLKEPLTNVWNRIIKRGFDIIFSLGVIVFVLSWLMPLISILILAESRGSVIFAQLRSGRDNIPFFCFKFRSMRVNADSNKVQASKNDPRITKTGAFIRKTSIDELPQFFNVLMGNMSIVGPRPHMLKHTEEYRSLIDRYMVRHLLKPGITGWAQVSGYRGETKEHHQMLGRVKHDIWYMENWSFMLDLKIIFKTVQNAVQGEENAF